MTYSKFEVFTQKTEDHYQAVLKVADKIAASVKETQLTKEGLEAKVEQIHDEVYGFPRFSLGTETKNLLRDDVSSKMADLLINEVSAKAKPLTQMIKITELSYTIGYSGGKKAVSLTVNRAKLQMKGELGENIIKLSFHIEGDDVNEFGTQVKQLKNSFLNDLTENAKEIHDYFLRKENEFNATVRARIEEKVRENKKLAEDYEKF